MLSLLEKHILWDSQRWWLKTWFIESVIFGLVGFYGISTLVGYLMPSHVYIYILNIYDLACLGFMAYQPL